MIRKPLWDKAQEAIAGDCLAAYKKANNGRKRHKPYCVPQRSRDLAGALGRGDQEMAAAILLYRFRDGASEPD